MAAGYKCECCGYYTHRRSTFRKHLARKFPCKERSIDGPSSDGRRGEEEGSSPPRPHQQLRDLVSPPPKPFPCPHDCGRSYGSQTALNAHLRSSRGRCEPPPFRMPTSVPELQALVEHLRAENAELRGRLRASGGRAPDGGAAGTPSGSEETPTEPRPHPFGEETVDHVSSVALAAAAEVARTNKANAILAVVEHVFFDAAHPENHNVRHKSARHVLVYTGAAGPPPLPGASSPAGARPIEPGWELRELTPTVQSMADRARRLVIDREIIPRLQRESEARNPDLGTARSMHAMTGGVSGAGLSRVRARVLDRLRARLTSPGA